MPVMAEDTAASPARLLARAGALAAEVLAPAAMSVEASQRVPPEHLDLLAAEGFYGLACRARPAAWTFRSRRPARSSRRWPAPACPPRSSGCSSTAWCARSPGRTTPGCAPACWGRCAGASAGPAGAGRTLPGPPRLRVRAVPGGYQLDGSSPWVTGWGLTDTLYVAARDEQDTIIWAVLDVPASGTLVTGTLSAELVQLVAVMASRTVALRFGQHFVPADRVVGTVPLAEWQHEDWGGRG